MEAMTLLASDAARQAQWSKIAARDQCSAFTELREITLNVTHDLVDDPDCCEWHFLPPALSFGGEQGPPPIRVMIGTHVALSHVSHNSRTMLQAHGFGSRAVRPLR